MPRQSHATIPATAARLMLLRGQGLAVTSERLSRRRAGGSELATLIEQLGFVQVDTINVVERAHHLTIWSRLPGYQPKTLAALLEKNNAVFEHWTHDASIIPLQWFPHWRHRFDRYRQRTRTNAWWQQRLGDEPDRVINEVRKRIEKDGPLLSRDFEHEGKCESWWGWKPQKAALEHLWRCGELAVARRVNFQKVYDLTARVFPKHLAVEPPAWEEHVEWACRTALERLGVATPTEIAAFWHAIDIAAARQWCAQAAERGEIEAVMVEAADGSPPRGAFVMGGFDAKEELQQAKPQAAMRILNPFDPVLRDRKRTKRLFDFEYTFEAFVPEAKRRYGYFVMPILEGDRLVGRINPKFHRDRGMLEIKGLWWEPRVKPTKARKAMLNDAINDLAAFIGAANVQK